MYDGILSSIFDRVRSQKWDDWKGDTIWMTFYFSAGVQYSILMMTAPRLHTKSRNEQGVVKAESGPEIEVPALSPGLKKGLCVADDSEEQETTESDKKNA